MPNSILNLHRRSLYVIAPKQEYFLRLNNAIEAGGWVDLQRTYREQGYWTLQKRIDPLLR